MSAIVRLALQRPYTFIVMAVMIVIMGAISAIRTPVDIFPEIKIPVAAVIWQYNGLSADEMSKRIISPFQRFLTTNVNGIKAIEARSMPGMGIIKIYLHEDTSIATATAQITALTQGAVRYFPPGTLPGGVMIYNASTVPILQLALSGKGLTEQQLADLGLNIIRTDLITVPGAGIPFPYGGRARQVQIDIDPQALQAHGLSPQDVTNAVAAQNQIVPAGFMKIGKFQYALSLNNVVGTIDEMNNIPVKTIDGATVYLRDVAYVRDGSAPQQNVVHVDGTRSVLMTVLKSGAISTLAIVEGVKKKLPVLQSALPESMRIVALGDQSIVVKAAISAVVHEGFLAATLTALMILLFLGSWRSTLIITLSIPLSILAAMASLAAFGQTFNIMTLGGLALAIGILVDDATVTVENMNWHLEQGKDVITSILDGAQQIVAPAFVSLLCICIVFVPMFFMPGVSGFLFVPMALSVIFAMTASFILSRTLLPTLAMYLLKPHKSAEERVDEISPNALVRFQRSFERKFDLFRDSYARRLVEALGNRRRFILGFASCLILSFLLLPFLGRDFFPSVDSGTIMLHARAPIGTRIEQTSAVFAEIQKKIRQVIPAAELNSIVDNIGQTGSGINTVYNVSGTIGPQDGDILIDLADGHRPTEEYIIELRKVLTRSFPTVSFSFLPSDMVSQILNFGTPAPIDIQIIGRKTPESFAYAEKILREVRKIPGLADVRIQQSQRYPELRFDVDRSRISQFALTERDVTNNVATAVAGTSQSVPIYWLDPNSGVPYPIVAQTPEYRLDSLSRFENIPVANATGGETHMLGGLGFLSRRTGNAVVSQYNLQTMVNIFATPQGRDLGAVASEVTKVLESLAGEKPKSVTVALRGQYETMNTAFTGMGLGLAGALVLVYLILVINFQSWLDPVVIIMALPGALAGIVWMLFITGTTLSVPALMGAIMCMGVGTANSILIVSFARERFAATGDPVQAALEAGLTRFRPVLMTALAMIIGMAPMAFGMGEGGEQNAPLGRAVIGGLILATLATLLLVPVMFAAVHRRRLNSLEQSSGAAHA